MIITKNLIITEIIESQIEIIIDNPLEMSTITVISGKGDKIRTNEVTITSTSNVLDLKKAYAKISKKNIHRLSFKTSDDKAGVRLDNDTRLLSSYSIVEGSKIYFKDLGKHLFISFPIKNYFKFIINFYWLYAIFIRFRIVDS